MPGFGQGPFGLGPFGGGSGSGSDGGGPVLPHTVLRTGQGIQPWLQINGVEVANAARVFGYIQRGLDTSGRWELGDGSLCDALFFDDDGATLPFLSPGSDPAPWWDASEPGAASFLGIVPLKIQGYDGVTARNVSQRIGGFGGGILGPELRQPRTWKFRAALVSSDDWGAEYALRWLQHVLTTLCDDCGTSYLDVRLACPPQDGTAPDRGRWRAYDVALVDGPHEVEQFAEGDNDFLGGCRGWITVEWAMVAANPYLYRLPETGAPRVTLGTAAGIACSVPVLAVPGAFMLPAASPGFADPAVSGDPGPAICAAVTAPVRGAVAPIYTIDSVSGMGAVLLEAHRTAPGSTPGAPTLQMRLKSIPAYSRVTVDCARRQITLKTFPSLAFSGNEITDEQRRTRLDYGGTGLPLGEMADDLPPGDGSTGVYGTATNLFRRGQVTGLPLNDGGSEGWFQDGVGSSLALDTTFAPPFSETAVAVATNGGAANQGVIASTATGLAAAAATPGAAGVWVRGVQGASYRARALWVQDDASTSAGGYTTFTASGGWQWIRCAPAIVGPGRTGDRLRVYVEVNGTRAETFRVAHAMLEQGQHAVSPYVATLGVPQTHPGADIQAPATLLDEATGWAAFRLVPGWDQGLEPGGGTGVRYLLDWRDDSANYIRAWYDEVSNTVRVERCAGGVSVVVAQTAVPAYGVPLSVVAAWTADHVKVSVQGAPMSLALSTAIPNLSSETFTLLGQTGATNRFRGAARWAAFGVGPITDADVALLTAFGTTNEPGIADLDAGSLPTAAWDGTAAAYDTGVAARDGQYLLDVDFDSAIEWVEVRECDYDGVVCARPGDQCAGGADTTIQIDLQHRE